MSARVYFMKTVNGCKDVSIMSPQDENVKTDVQVYSVCILKFLLLLNTYICSQNINKQIVNIADEIPTDYSFLSRDH